MATHASTGLQRPASSTASTLARRFAYAWVIALLFYVVEYAARSSPAVMIPELAKAFAIPTAALGSILGAYYYSYSIVSLLAGALLDRVGARYVVSGGAAVLALGCILFIVATPSVGYTGRLLQGAGSAFAFTGAVYLASRGLPARVLATAIGATQCVAMLGAAAGQFVLGPMITAGVPWQDFWIAYGIFSALIAVGLVVITPAPDAVQVKERLSVRSFLEPYRVVFSNPQSYLCGLVAGLLFTPTVIGDMTWGVTLFQADHLDYAHSVVVVSMVPLGWAIGCPLMGWAADHIGRRKPVLIGGALLMLAVALQITFWPTWLSPVAGLLVFGIGSGAAMLPYTIIKESNPDEVKGCATGVLNFINFGIAAVVGPVFARHFAQATAGSGTPFDRFHNAGLFWIAVIVIATVASVFLRETGRCARRL